MYMEEQSWEPYIISAELDPVSAIVGQKVKIKVKVLDRLGGQQPEDWFFGNLYSGEV